MLPITLQMSHVEVIWLLNWPSNEALLCWGGGDTRNGQKRRFLLNPPLLENFLVKFFSWVVPWERERTQLSDYVGHIGVHMIKNIVIAAQSQDRSAKVGSSRKIPDVTKKRHGNNFDFWGLKLNQREPNMVGSTLIQWQRSKLKIVAMSF